MRSQRSTRICQMCGEANPYARLTDDIVRSMRQRHASEGARLTQLAAEHGVDKTTAWMAVTRRSWKHVD